MHRRLTMIGVMAALIAIPVLLIGCGGKDKSPSEELSSELDVSKNEEVQEAANLGITKIYTEATPLKDVSIGGAKRLIVAITIPVGSSEEDAKSALMQAAEEIGNREKPGALAVKGFFEGEDVSPDRYSFGEAIWAPGGNWANAGGSEKKEVSVRIGNPLTGKYPQ